MRLSDLIKMGLMNLWRRKGRTILTILGVIIGSLSVVLMVSIALGSEKATMEMVESFGNIRVVQIRGEYSDYYKYYQDDAETGGGIRKEKSDEKKLDEEAVKTFENMEHVESVLPYYEAELNFKVGKLRASTSAVACDLEKLQTMGFELGKGRLPKPGEKAFISFPMLNTNFYDPHARNQEWGESDTEVFGNTLNTYFVQDTGKNGRKKTPIRLDAVGETKLNSEYSWQALIDIETFKDMRIKDIRKYGNYNVFRRDKNKDLYNGIKVLVDNTDNVLAVSDAITDMGYQADNQVEFMEEMKKQSSIMTYVLGGIGAVALFVAAIGIANTMVMAIYERTREIGVMKVLGAEIFDILKLFLLEAALIGLIGGVIGLGLSYVGSHFINAAVAGSENMPPDFELSYIPMWLALSSIVFSTLIGVIFGIFPAIKATRLSALEAIKTQG